MITRTVYLVATLSAIGGFLFGYDIGVISGILPMNRFVEKFPTTPFKQGTVVSSLLAGCFGGALISSYSADRFGRRFSILGGSMIFILGAILQSASDGFAMLYAGRVISGISIGILSMMVPLYQSEISPKEIRGRLVSIQQFAITIGIAVSFWVDYGTSFMDSNAQWRIPMAVQAIPAVILGVGTIYLPFSPRWLMNNDRNEEALDVLARIRSNGDKTAPAVESEYNEIKENVLFEREYALKSYSELWKRGPENVRKRMILGILIQIFQQLTGINAILYYAPQIFQDVGVKGTSASILATGINGIVNVVSTIPAIIYVDRWGRRPVLVFGAISMCTCLFLVGILSTVFGVNYYDTETGKNMVQLDNVPASYATIIFILLFVASFAISWGPVGWIYPAEIYPLRIRGKAVSVTTASNWLFNFAVGQMTPVLLDRITSKTYFVYSSFCLLMAVVVFTFYPETKGKSLEEMDELFGKIDREVKQPPSGKLSEA